MSTDDPASKPATPRRTTSMRSLAGLFRTPTAVSRRNKRTRARTSSLSSTSTPLTSDSTPSLPPVVLQTYSVSTDSIVLTALPSVPFCCHEDLLTMSRAQLEGVVRALNARLPHRMRIGPETEVDFWNNYDGQEDADECDDGLSRMSEAEMRKRIEELVGIRAVVGKNRVSRSGLGLDTRAGVPPAPKAVRTRDATWRLYEKSPWEMEVDTVDDQNDDLSVMIEDALMGSSPLAGRTKSGPHAWGRNGALSRLAILREENEGGESSEDDETRPFKRQRVGFESFIQHSEERSQTVQEARDSRLVENMDISGSPLLSGEDDPSSDNDTFSESNETVPPIVMGVGDGVETSKEYEQAPLQRRRSARLRDIYLKRGSSANAGKKIALSAMDPISTIVRSKTTCSRRSLPATVDGSVAEGGFGSPREFTIRLPFTSTPPQMSDTSAWSTPRILRSHSQRLLRSEKTAKTGASLGRSQSARYPRATDLAFVTTDRPRYRFTRRKSKGTKLDNTQQNTLISTKDSNVKHADQKENEDPNIVAGKAAIGGLGALLCSFPTPRSRAASTSTVASVRRNDSDSPARGEGTTMNTEIVENDGATERVWAALGRMAVDGFE